MICNEGVGWNGCIGQWFDDDCNWLDKMIEIETDGKDEKWQMRRQDYILLCAEPVELCFVLLITISINGINSDGLLEVKMDKDRKREMERSFDFWQGKKVKNAKMESESDWERWESLEDSHNKIKMDKC